MSKKLKEIGWFNWLLLGVCTLTLVAVVAPRFRQMPRRPMPKNQDNRIIELKDGPRGAKPNAPRGGPRQQDKK